METREKKFILEAVRLSAESIKNGGGPFGALIVKENKIIAKSSNSVTKDKDPTAHAEINVIRKACKVLNTFDLSGCEIYTSCEPCPMCFGAIYWARLDKIYFANTQKDAESVGFDDSFIYDEISLKPSERKIPNIKITSKEALNVFKEWKNKDDKIEY